MVCIKLFDKFAVVLMLSLSLAACGGGAGSNSSPTPTPPPTTPTPIPPPPTTTPKPAPTLPPAPAPPSPTTLTSSTISTLATLVPAPTPAQEVTVPNLLIPTVGTGTKDTYYMANCVPTNNLGRGCFTNRIHELVNVLEIGFLAYGDGLTLGHRRIEGPILRNPQLEALIPPRDVRQAWRDGWTGRDVDLLILDEFGLPSSPPADASTDTHGYSVALSFLEIAPSANIHGANFGLGGSITEGMYLQGGLVVGSNQRIEVVNMSFGRRFDLDPSSMNVSSLNEMAILAQINSYQSSPSFADLRGQGGQNSLFSNNLEDAVLVKAAGNSRVDAVIDVSNVALVADSHTGPRTLIVGALDKYARTSNPEDRPNISTRATIAGYSNRAGATNLIQQRFLVEYGGTPYGERAFLCDSGTPASSGCLNPQLLDPDGPTNPSPQGTSFAAPRVSGFAALVRGKFPGLSGGQTAKILLDTATTQGLACHQSGQKDHQNCGIEIYGQGRVDIGSALSPIGKLN